MPSVGHIAVGLAASRLAPVPRLHRVAWAVALVALSCLPDADVIAFTLGIPYSAPFGHRGASHSLVFAAACGVLVGLLALFTKLPAWRVGVVAGDGGLGVALLWPFSDTRYFASWRPIPVAPIGSRLFAQHGIELMLHECLLFLPFFIAALWPRQEAARVQTAG
jgi:inner membrane protein